MLPPERNCSNALMVGPASRSRSASGRRPDLFFGRLSPVFRLLSCAISTSQLVDFAVSLIGDFCQQEKIRRSEAVGVLPVVLIVAVAALEGDGVVRLAVAPVLPDSRGDREHA